MHGLCHTYGLSKAHYICWSQSQGILVAEVTWDKRLWDEVLYPRYKDFADLWAIRAVPERMNGEDKQELLALIKQYNHVTELPAISRTMQQLEQQ